MSGAGEVALSMETIVYLVCLVHGPDPISPDAPYSCVDSPLLLVPFCIPTFIRLIHQEI